MSASRVATAATGERSTHNPAAKTTPGRPSVDYRAAGPIDSAMVLFLQRCAGNRAVSSLLARTVQRQDPPAGARAARAGGRSRSRLPREHYEPDPAVDAMLESARGLAELQAGLETLLYDQALIPARRMQAMQERLQQVVHGNIGPLISELGQESPEAAIERALAEAVRRGLLRRDGESWRVLVNELPEYRQHASDARFQARFDNALERGRQELRARQIFDVTQAVMQLMLLFMGAGSRRGAEPAPLRAMGEREAITPPAPRGSVPPAGARPSETGAPPRASQPPGGGSSRESRPTNPEGVFNIESPAVTQQGDGIRVVWSGERRAVVNFQVRSAGEVVIGFINAGGQRGRGAEMLASAMRAAARQLGMPELARPRSIESGNVVNSTIVRLIRAGRVDEATAIVRRAANQYAAALGGRAGEVSFVPGPPTTARVTIEY